MVPDRRKRDAGSGGAIGVHSPRVDSRRGLRGHGRSLADRRGASFASGGSGTVAVVTLLPSLVAIWHDRLMYALPSDTAPPDVLADMVDKLHRGTVDAPASGPEPR
jgi:hypothetical protein